MPQRAAHGSESPGPGRQREHELETRDSGAHNMQDARSPGAIGLAHSPAEGPPSPNVNEAEP